MTLIWALNSEKKYFPRAPRTNFKRVNLPPKERALAFQEVNHFWNLSKIGFQLLHLFKLVPMRRPRDTSLFQFLDFSIHDIYRFFHKVEFVIEPKLFYWNDKDSSDRHFFKLEMWKVLWTLLSSLGSSSVYATGLTLFRILNGPILQALSNLHYLFGGFLDYLWSRELDIFNLVPTDRSKYKYLKVQCKNHDNSPPLDISKDHFKDFFNSNDDSTSIDDDYFSIDDIVFVEASPLDFELVSLEEVKDDILHEKLLNIHLLIDKIESLNVNPTLDCVLKSPSPFPIPIELDQGELTSVVMEDNFREPRVHVPNVLTTHPTLMLDSYFIPSDNSLPESKIFCFDIEEKNSGSTTTHADISLLDFNNFHFKSEPDPRDLTSIIDLGIHENVSPTTNVNLPFEDDQSPLFAYVVWIFLHFLTYPVAPSYLLSFENKDSIFDPGISIYHSFMLGLSHHSGTFMKFSVYSNHLSERLPWILKNCALGFILRSLDLHILSFNLGIQYPNLID
nr:hypothetical protein [Tanacetum cinerariifolium]